jgi:hypothetical protein
MLFNHHQVGFMHHQISYKSAFTDALVIQLEIMKLSALFATVSALARRDAKRYSQLTDMMEHYNADFDSRQYWAYGCNCLLLGK